MNIFHLDKDPIESARFHCDKHVCKMIVETAQMLCTAHRIVDPQWAEDMKLMKAGFRNHPMTIWVRTSQENYRWAFRLFQGLLDEYEHRYGRLHKCIEHEMGLLSPPPIPDIGFTEVPLCMPNHCKNVLSHVRSYREYYRKEKRYFAKWTKRDVPYWFDDPELV
tara:strand:+ start:329 stop:820 length:492 start_codon:yes stop_codon:yes gene_type:complete